MVIDKLIFENAEGAETRTKKLQKLADKHNEQALITMKNDGWSISATTTYQAVDAGGVLAIDMNRDKLRYNQATKTLEILEDGIITMELMMSLAFPLNVELYASVFVNGEDSMPFSPLTAQGRGATKPITVLFTSTEMLSKGDKLQMRMKVDTASTVTCTGANSRVEKKTIG